MQRAIFLDRDGTVNIDTSYINRADEIKLFAGAGEAISIFNQAGYLVILVTNQSGIGRGYFQEDALHDIHQRLCELIAKDGGKIDQIYYSPYYEQASEDRYQERPEWRKPQPGMLFHAAQEFDIDLKNSVMIGDRKSDIIAGKRAGTATALVLTGDGPNDWPKLHGSEDQPDYVFPDLRAAARYLCAENPIGVDTRK